MDDFRVEERIRGNGTATYHIQKRYNGDSDWFDVDVNIDGEMYFELDSEDFALAEAKALYEEQITKTRIVKIFSEDV